MLFRSKVIGQQPGDVAPLIDHLGLNEVALNEIKRFSAPNKGRNAEVLLVLGEKSETTQTVRLVPTGVDYWVATTYPRERTYRSWYLAENHGRPLIELYKELAARFPHGLAGEEPLPEEVAGVVQRGRAELRPLAV
mgnify:FL=1